MSNLLVLDRKTLPPDVRF